jgi:hypothetical protein
MSYAVTKDQLASVLGIEPDAAYALICLGESIGLVSKAGSVQIPGKKGKGPNLYRVQGDFILKLNVIWNKSLNKLKEFEAE